MIEGQAYGMDAGGFRLITQNGGKMRQFCCLASFSRTYETGRLAESEEEKALPRIAQKKGAKHQWGKWEVEVIQI